MSPKGRHCVSTKRQSVKKLKPYSEGGYDKKVIWLILKVSFLLFSQSDVRYNLIEEA
jgi:hypothetical protein